MKLFGFSRYVVSSSYFEAAIIGVILINAVVIGLDAYPVLHGRYQDIFALINGVCLGIFILEIILKLMSHMPRPLEYFRDPWNGFDFTIVALSLMPMSGSWATLARLARLLRVLRLISAFPELRLIVSTLIKTIPSMFHVSLLMLVIFYIYAVLGYHLFHDVDPTHWRDLSIAFLTLFRIVTLEDWTDVMYTAMDVNPLAWMYFVSFVIVGTFVVVNLFIAVVINNLESAKLEALKELTDKPSRDDILNELEATKDALKRLQERLEDFDTVDVSDREPVTQKHYQPIEDKA